MSKWYPDNSKRQRSILSFFILEEWFILNIKDTACWSVIMVNLLPMRNSLHLRTASITAVASLSMAGCSLSEGDKVLEKKQQAYCAERG